MSVIPDRTATTDAPILDVLAERWSTRIFDGQAPLDEPVFASALEAARWAPSASNTQPTRYIVARRGTDVHARVIEALMGFNQEWAGNAAALVVVLAETQAEDGTARRWSLYDAGQAAAHFTVQAHANGLFTHTMGGFEPDRIRADFALDERLVPVTVIAVGALGEPATVSEKLRERESAPRTRLPLTETVLVDA